MSFRKRYAPNRSSAESVAGEQQSAGRSEEPSPPHVYVDLGMPPTPCAEDEKTEADQFMLFKGKLTPEAGLKMKGGRAIVPYTHSVTLPYVQLLTLSSPSTGNLIAGKVFNLLSAYDPNYTDLGHQPLGFDEWSNLYTQYYVESVRWEVEFSNTSSSYTLIGNAMNHASLTLVGSQADTYLEQPGAQSVILRHSNAGGPVKLTGQFRTAIWFGCQNKELRLLDDIRAGIGASPAEAVGLHVGIGTFATHATQSVYAKVKLNMRVVFLKPVQLAGS
jgi:hypothetical protein